MSVNMLTSCPRSKTLSEVGERVKGKADARYVGFAEGLAASNKKTTRQRTQQGKGTHAKVRPLPITPDPFP